MKKLSLFVVLLSVVSCQFEGVKKDRIEDKKEQLGQDTSNDTLNEDTFPLDSSSLITDVDSVKLDTTSGNQKELSSGVKIKWLKKNTGNPVKKGQVIWVNYKGFLPNGMMFDGDKAATQSVPLMVGVGMMVPGVEEALLQLHVGDYVKLLIPSDQGFGKDGFMNVPPDTDLLYEIAVREIEAPQVVDKGVKIWKVKAANNGSYENGDQVSFHYMAYHKNGKLYFDSYRNQSPFQFKKGSENIMPGLNIAFDHLQKGDMAFVELPSTVAYGSQGLKDLVPPHTDIVYYIKSVD